MDYYQKYLKYRSKYVNLKNKKIELIGGSRVINLDQYKDLFRRCIHELPNEIGFNLLLDNDTINFEITKGNYRSVSIPYNNVINIHSHPIALETSRTFEYHPPTHPDYGQSCFDCFKGTQWNIVVEKAGVWLYRPNKKLITEIEEIQPNVKELFSIPIEEGIKQIPVDGATEEFIELHNVILNNTSNEGIYLNFEGVNIRNILSEAFINTYIGKKIETTGDDREESIQIYGIEAERILPMLSTEQLYTNAPHYHKISFDEYIHNITNIVSNGEAVEGDKTYEMGFDIKFIRWDEPFNIEIELDESTERIFGEIKSRNYLINNYDVLRANFDRTEEFFIIKP